MAHVMMLFQCLIFCCLGVDLFSAALLLIYLHKTRLGHKYVQFHKAKQGGHILCLKRL